MRSQQLSSYSGGRGGGKGAADFSKYAAAVPTDPPPEPVVEPEVAEPSTRANGAKRSRKKPRSGGTNGYEPPPVVPLPAGLTVAEQLKLVLAASGKPVTVAG